MTTTEGREIAFEAQGAGALVTVCEPDLLPGVAGLLPWGARERSPAPSDRRFELVRHDGSGYAVIEEGDVRHTTDSRETALVVLANYLLVHVLLRARDVLFVHAGAVGHRGRAIVLPGFSGIGKSTLVAALVKAGADYYTDDYMPLDGAGRVHPYPIPLWFNDPETGRGISRSVNSLGGVSGVDEIPVGIVAHLPYRDGAGLSLEPRTEGGGIMLLLENALGSDLRPEFALTVARHGVTGARVFDGERDDPDEAAAALLELADS